MNYDTFSPDYKVVENVSKKGTIMAKDKKNSIPCICLPYQGFECIYCEIPDEAFLDTNVELGYSETS